MQWVGQPGRYPLSSSAVHTSWHSQHPGFAEVHHPDQYHMSGAQASAGHWHWQHAGQSMAAHQQSQWSTPEPEPYPSPLSLLVATTPTKPQPGTKDAACQTEPQEPPKWAKPPKPPVEPVWCPDCETWLNGPSQWEDHKIGEKHIKNYNKHSARIVKPPEYQATSGQSEMANWLNTATDAIVKSQVREAPQQEEQERDDQDKLQEKQTGRQRRAARRRKKDREPESAQGTGEETTSENTAQQEPQVPAQEVIPVHPPGDTGASPGCGAS